MRLEMLDLRNVGPFDEASIRFLDAADDPRRVALLTGENGTGKTVVLDAIRACFEPRFGEIERDLRRRDADLSIIGRFAWGHFSPPTVELWLTPTAAWGWPQEIPAARRSGFPPQGQIRVDQRIGWVVDYWRSDVAHDPTTISGLRSRDHRRAAWSGALQGAYTNVDVAQELCFLDYLRDSRSPEERRAGEALWAVAERIVERSLLAGGKLSHVERSTFTPMVDQAGHTVPLANLSSGNASMIGRMVTLLGRMYSASVADGSDPTHAAELPGILLLDEAENHLHPLWQKRFLPTVLAIFPNLQIVATTHSPFVLGSLPDARVFVCRFDPEVSACTIAEAPLDYANAPFDEILASAAFDGTLPFSADISALMHRRSQATDPAEVAAIEAELKARNPTYFGFLDLERKIRELRR